DRGPGVLLERAGLVSQITEPLALLALPPLPLSLFPLLAILVALFLLVGEFAYLPRDAVVDPAGLLQQRVVALARRAPLFHGVALVDQRRHEFLEGCRDRLRGDRDLECAELAPQLLDPLVGLDRLPDPIQPLANGLRSPAAERLLELFL